jgi:hypothetical protein
MFSIGLEDEEKAARRTFKDIDTPFGQTGLINQASKSSDENFGDRVSKSFFFHMDRLQ